MADEAPKEQCIFCDEALAPGSPEHVFMSALGGRLVTKHAICADCNNGFSSSAGGLIDNALADAFVIVRCALNIWTGRNQPPPTIERAGTMDDGTEYDLGPGLVPFLRPAKIPKVIPLGPNQFVANSRDDAGRILDILGKRGLRAAQLEPKAVSEKVPGTHLQMKLELRKICRSLAKTALTAACVVYGNASVRRAADKSLLVSIRQGTPDINDFAGIDYTGEWPSEVRWTSSNEDSDVSPSGFEHSVMFADVGPDWVAYVSIFGDFRFSVRLGDSSGLPPAALALDPRAKKQSRFSGTFVIPNSFMRPVNGRYLAEFDQISQAVNQVMNNILRRWHSDSQTQLDSNRNAELKEAIEACGESRDQINEAIARVLEKWMMIERGERWQEDIEI